MTIREFDWRLKREAESQRPASVAQLEEQGTFTPEVAGSTPAGGTKPKRKFLNRVVELEMEVTFEADEAVKW